MRVLALRGTTYACTDWVQCVRLLRTNPVLQGMQGEKRVTARVRGLGSMCFASFEKGTTRGTSGGGRYLLRTEYRLKVVGRVKRGERADSQPTCNPGMADSACSKDASPACGTCTPNTDESCIILFVLSLCINQVWTRDHLNVEGRATTGHCSAGLTEKHAGP